MKGTIVAFRTDASLQIGTGHVMRCLALADGLRAAGARCTFICREHAGNLLHLIRNHGFDAASMAAPNPGPPSYEDARAPYAAWLGTDWQTDAWQTHAAVRSLAADLLIVDHYALDAQWERILRPCCRSFMVIDDLADRPHDCDLLLDQTLGREEEAYTNMTPTGCVTLVGPRYALLRSEFPALRESSLARRAVPRLERLLISLGGVDAGNATGEILRLLPHCALPEQCEITVIARATSPWLAAVSLQVERLPWRAQMQVDVRDMARLMAESDLSIGAAGTTSWERCCLGLPALLVVLADNQQTTAEAVDRAGAAVNIGRIDDLRRTLKPALELSLNAARLAAMSRTARDLVDGEGVPRVINRLRGVDE